MDHFLFDLDGTLLPMKQEEFVRYYLPLLAARFQDRGFSPEQLIGAVWKGFERMVANDGSRTNEEVFWDSFSKDLSIRREEVETEVLDFYGNDFNQAICTTRPDPFAAEIIRYLKEKGKLCIMSLTDGATPQDTRIIPFKRIMRPMYPIDEI